MKEEYTAIFEKHTTENHTQHSDKADEQSDNSHVVRSLAAKKALNEFSHDFACFIRSEYHVKRVADITPAMCQHFIDTKLESGVCSETAHTYRSYLAKLEKCVLRAYGARVDYSVTIDESKVQNNNPAPCPDRSAAGQHISALTG